MLLNKIIIEDFGVYGGRNEFEITSSRDKPIVLFCGMNGAGKTTLFESISLCLYGQRSIEPRITKKQYDERILKSFHRNAAKSAKHASISLEFDHYHAGDITTYLITRSWYREDGRPTENLMVMKKSGQGETFENLGILESSQWQTFVDQILPKGITKMFIFDGEKIEKIAQSGNEDEHIKSSFDALLKLDLVEQLHRDIGLYVLRNSHRQTQKILDEIEKDNAEKRKSEIRIEEFQEKQTYLEADIHKTKRLLDNHEEKFTRLGGQFAQNRQDLIAEKAKLEQQESDLQDAIRDMCSNTLPLALIPKQMKSLRRGISLDMKKLQDMFAAKILREGFADVAKGMKKYLNVDGQMRRDVIGALDLAVQDKIDSLSNLRDLSFNMSIEDMRDMMDEIEEILEFDSDEIADLTKDYEDIIESLSEVNAGLEMAPQQDEIGPIFTQIIRASGELAELEKELEHIKNLEAQEKTKVVLINARLRKNLTQKKADSRSVAGIEIAPRVQDALEQYARELRLEKVAILESNILHSMNILFHKKDFVQSISIDPNTFEITMYKNGLEMTRDMLSPGELQIYATAIVWGLTKTSGRPLPFIIDTPLARLDNGHRKNLVSSFYPYASHQTVILSTDSEITEPHYEAIRNKISRTVTISYSGKRGATVQSEGYFAGGNN